MPRLDGKLAKSNPLESFVEDYKAKGDLRKVATVTLGNWGGREIELWTRQSESKARILLKGSHIITLIVEVPFGQGTVLQRDADRFFASLKVKE